jgi:non-ribosomal peptide synthetase component F
LRLSDLQVAPVAVDSAGAKFPLALLVYEAQEGITCLFEYNTALFDESTISRIAEDYEIVLERVTREPAVRIGVLDEILAERERQDLRQRESRYDDVVRGKLQDMVRRVAN